MEEGVKEITYEENFEDEDAKSRTQ